jgi:hypothetical protein
VSAATEDDSHEVRLYHARPPALLLGLMLDGDSPVRPGWRKPTVLAAHESRLLLRVHCLPEVKLLIFAAGGAISSLVAVPPLQDVNLGILSLSRGSGLISDGDEYKVVAFLQTRVNWCGGRQLEIARVLVYSSWSGDWKVIELDMPSFLSPSDPAWRPWRHDSTVSFRGSISWVDYSRGLITCDVLDDNPSIYFMRLPVLTPRTQLSWMLNNLCVTEGQLRFLRTTRGPGHHECTITVWRLDTEGYRWHQEGGVILTCGARLPRFPLLSGLDSSMVYFMLQQGEAAKYVYAFNWNDATFVARYPYLDDTSRGQPVDTAYIGSDLVRYVAEHPGNITKPLHTSYCEVHLCLKLCLVFMN